MKPGLFSLLSESKSVCIMLPKNPYLDQVASALAIFLALKDKNPLILCDTPMTVEFNRLVGVNKISQSAGNKNMILKLVNYPPANVERVTYDVDGQNLFLLIAPLPGINPPTPENVQITYSGVSAETCILVGGANESHFPLLSTKDFASMKLIHIGINELNLGQRQVVSLARPASSISELISHEINESGKIDADIATNLFAGLIEGTRNFSSNSVNAETFQTAAVLVSKGARRDQMKPQIAPAQRTLDKPQDASVPRSWVEPKIFKSTNVN